MLINYRDHLIPYDSTVKQALLQLNKLSIDAILFVVDECDRLVGSVTDGDVRRGLINGASIDNSISNVLQSNPRYIRKGERDISKVIAYREGNLRIVPILDKDNRVLNVINFRETRSYLPIDAVIMAGGRGQRLGRLTETKPKPLLPVGSRPIIEHNLNRLSLFGIDDYWITLNYLGTQVEDFLGDGSEKNIRIKYVWEDNPMGTIGAVSKIKEFNHDYVLITNSDLLTNLDYEHFFLEFLKQDADMAVVTIPYKVNIPYAVLETKNEHVINFKEKPTYIYYSNGGIYLVKRSILEMIPENIHFNATDLMELLIKENRRVFSYPLIGYWLDIGSPEDYQKAQQDLDSIKF